MPNYTGFMILIRLLILCSTFLLIVAATDSDLDFNQLKDNEPYWNKDHWVIKGNWCKESNKSFTGVPEVGLFRKQCLHYHNEYRMRHHAPLMKLDRKMNEFAQEYAEHLAKPDVKFGHRKNNPYGENLYKAENPTTTFSCKQALKCFYWEVEHYDFSTPKFQKKAGHFTQVIWRGSTLLGCGLATTNKTDEKTKKSDLVIIVVCNYKPAGNVMGSFYKNVKPAINNQPIREYQPGLNYTDYSGTGHVMPWNSRLILAIAILAFFVGLVTSEF